MSVTTIVDASDGPAFVIVRVYVNVAPAFTGSGLSVLVMIKSADGASVSTSCAELFPRFVSVTPAGAATKAVFVIEPLADPETVALTVYVTVPPTSRFAVVFKLPEPLGAPHDEPLDAEHVHVTLVNAAGKVSVIVALFTTLGPAFVATIAYTNACPGTAVV